MRKRRAARPWERAGQPFWDWYDDYLRSDAWQEKRRAVLKRANGICEGCGKALARHVHHLTYAHAGHELLFEMVALCEACHRICHPDKT